MKANHFRIGNLIDCSKINAGICTIDCIEENRIGVKETPPLWGYIGEDEFEPIPLTEEWLLKFGFKKIGRLFYHESFWACELSSNGELRFEDLDNLYIKHIHRLQNLYFALTGEELKFN